MAVRKIWPDKSGSTDKRQKFYEDRVTVSLSESYSAGMALCAEEALLAQLYFQRAGIASHLNSGHAIWHYNANRASYAEGHTYTTIRDLKNGKVILYDPSNPFELTPGQPRPRLAAVDAYIWDRTVQRSSETLTLTEVVTTAFSQTRSFYGFGLYNETCVHDGHFLSSDPTVPTTKLTANIMTAKV